MEIAFNKTPNHSETQLKVTAVSIVCDWTWPTQSANVLLNSTWLCIRDKHGITSIKYYLLNKTLILMIYNASSHLHGLYVKYSSKA